jgi:hypothetical protein
MFAVLMVGCSEVPRSKPQPQLRQQNEQARAYILPGEFVLESRAERGPEGEVYVEGSTNFPDGMKMWIQVEEGKLPLGTPRVVAEDKVFLQDGRFRTAALFAESKNPNYTREMEKWPDGKSLRFVKATLPSGNHKVRFSAYFNGAWQSPAVLSMLGGEGGKNLRGRLLKLTDPDVVDSDRTLDFLSTVIFPPLEPGAKAISIVKAAILTVPGEGKSATNIELNLKLFMSTPGLSEAKGWSANARSGTTYDVAYDFMNGDQGEQQAVWSVDLETGKVKYVNKNAKLFSWTPDY